MNWSRAKTILIAILIAVNVLLLSSLLLYINNEKKLESSALLDVAEILSKDGIVVHAETQKLSTKTMLTYECARDVLKEQQFAENLIGACETILGDDESLSCKNESGEILFTSDSAVEGRIKNDGNISEKTDLLSIAKAVFKKAKIENYQVIQEGDSIKAISYIEAAPLVNGYLEISLLGEEINLSGKWLFTEPINIGEKPKNASELLLMFRNELKDLSITQTEITSVQNVYIASQATGGRIKLLPAWHIICKDAEYYIDIVRGTLMEQDQIGLSSEGSET